MKRKILICLLRVGISALVPPPRNSGAGLSMTRPTTTTRCFAITSSSSISCNFKRATQKLPPSSTSLADGAIRQKHARSLSRVVFAMAKRHLAQHLWEHSLVD